MKNKVVKFLLLGLIIILCVSITWFLIIKKEKKTYTEEKLACPNCNVVVISLTNVRKDHISLYGYDRQTTPNIDEFFKNSLIFENAFAPASWTLPNATSFFTSLFPYSHGVMERVGGMPLKEEVTTLPKILQEKGYATAAFTGDGDYNRKFGLSGGFDFYLDSKNYKDFLGEDAIALGRSILTYLPLRSYVSLANNWLKDNSKNNFFLLIQGYDAHCPFRPTEPFDKKFTGDLKSQLNFSNCLWTFDKTDPVYKNGIKYWPVKTDLGDDDVVKDVLMTEEDIKYMLALYDGAINQADSNLKTLFDEFKDLGLEKNTIFIFMAEHGDMFGEHGRFMRGGPLRGTFYDPVVNFPIIIKHPNISEPIVINDLVETVDFMPTILKMLGIKDPQAKIRQGKSLAFSNFGDSEVNQYVYAASNFSPLNTNIFFDGISDVQSIRNKDWKLIKESVSNSKEFKEKYGQNNIQFHELYNIKEDPHELNNVYDTNPDIVSELEGKLNQWINGLKKPDQIP